MVLRDTARLTLLGCAVGAAIGLAVTRSMAGILFGITPRDPLTFVAAIAVLVAVALGAAYLPGRRAARTNAIEALRLE